MLGIIEKEEKSSEQSASSSKATGAESHPSASTTHSRSTGGSAPSGGQPGPRKATYTDDQVKLVRKVRTCKITEYYEILGLEKSCEEADVKKAYRKVRTFEIDAHGFIAKLNDKLALQLHPDKNGAPGADEAFKSERSEATILAHSH